MIVTFQTATSQAAASPPWEIKGTYPGPYAAHVRCFLAKAGTTT